MARAVTAQADSRTDRWNGSLETGARSRRTRMPEAASSPSPPAAAAPIDQPKDQQKHHRADRGGDDRGAAAAAEMNTQFRQQISATRPKPVPRTICPASQPAIRPTIRMTRRLSPDMTFSHRSPLKPVQPSAPQCCCHSGEIPHPSLQSPTSPRRAVPEARPIRRRGRGERQLIRGQPQVRSGGLRQCSAGQHQPQRRSQWSPNTLL